MIHFTEITDFEAPELDVFARLTEAQLLNRFEPKKGMLIAESPKVIQRALDAGCVPVSLLVERGHCNEEAQEAIERCGDVPVYTASMDVLTKLTGFQLTRGMLCAMLRPKQPELSEILAASRRVAVLENVMNPTNVGAIFRSAAALGMDAVLLTSGCTDPLYRRSARVSMGTVFQVPWTYLPGNWQEVLKEQGFATAAMALTEDSLSIEDPVLRLQDRLAVVLGTEGDGLAASTIAACDYTVKIPMYHGVDSLNVAAASAVAFWELRARYGEAMLCDCHIHVVLDGADWRAAIARHREKPEDDFLCGILETYKNLGFTYLRDGGDRWGAGRRAKELARSYGITYRTPCAPLYKAGHYGGFIGKKFQSFREYRQLIEENGKNGADFVKIMISGLMDFDRFGVLTEPGLPGEEIGELIHIAHEEGFAVMAHANGSQTVLAAARAGVDSIEHGAYLGEEALAAMKEAGTVWVPTLSAIGNLRGKGRFREDAVEQILASAQENVKKFAAMGGLLAPGTDAGAWSVPHGSLTEYALLEQALGEKRDSLLEKGIAVIREKF